MTDPTRALPPGSLRLLLVLAGFALFDLAVSLTLGLDVGPGSRLPGLVLLALASSQITLLAQWLALADTRMPLRIAFVAAGLALLAAIFWRTGKFDDLLPSLMLIFVPQALSLLVARWAGWRILRESPLESRLAPWQFSLWQGIVTVTAFSIFFGVARLFHDSKLIDREFTAFLGLNLSLTVCSLWAGMGTAPAERRIPLAFLLGNVLSMGLIAIVVTSRGKRIDEIHWWAVAVIANLQMILIVGPLLVLRRFGFRFVRIRA